MSETVNIRELNDLVAGKSNFVNLVTQGMDQTIVGQKHLVDSLLIALLSNGHILLEGVPGLAKTLAIKTLAQVIDAKYSRIQFTPDLLPADVTGTMIYSIQKEQFQIKKGPIFANFVPSGRPVPPASQTFHNCQPQTDPRHPPRCVPLLRRTGRGVCCLEHPGDQ